MSLRDSGGSRRLRLSPHTSPSSRRRRYQREPEQALPGTLCFLLLMLSRLSSSLSLHSLARSPAALRAHQFTKLLSTMAPSAKIQLNGKERTIPTGVLINNEWVRLPCPARPVQRRPVLTPTSLRACRLVLTARLGRWLDL